jgi:site-specific recombinase XerC
VTLRCRAPGVIRGQEKSVPCGERGTVVGRRDYAIISMFKDTGAGLSELAGLGLDDVSPASREATVTGKGDKHRTGRFT